MTEMDADEFWDWVRNASQSQIESMVLQYVTIETYSDVHANQICYLIRDKDNQILKKIYVDTKDVVAENYSPKRRIARALLEDAICGSCGDRLIASERTICTLCEAKQVSSLLAICRDLIR